jgi:hypothetical protein
MCGCIAVIVWEKDGVRTRRLTQRQARWLHALSCLIVLTGNRGELFGLVMTRARGLVGIVGRGDDQDGARVVLAECRQISFPFRPAGDLSLVSVVEGTSRFVHDSSWTGLNCGEFMRLWCACYFHASWPLQGACRPRAAALVAPRRQSGVLQPIVRRSQSATRKKAHWNETKQEHTNQSLLRPFNQVLHKFMWVEVGK